MMINILYFIEEIKLNNEIRNKMFLIIDKGPVFTHSLYSIGQKLGPLIGTTGTPRLK